MLAAFLQSVLQQRVLVLVISISLLIAGAVTWQQLRIDAYPEISPTQVKIILKAPGLPPEELETRVTRKIEVELLGIPNQSMLRSVIKYGITDITLDFAEGTDIYWARQQVSERLAAVWPDLPEDISGGIAAMSTPLGELFMFTIDGPQSLEEKRQILDWQIRPRLRTIAGVADINALGGRVESWQVIPDIAALARIGLSLNDLHAFLLNNNRNDGAGRLNDGEESIIVSTRGRLTGPDDLGNRIVSYVNGAPVHLRDVAKIELGSLTRYGGVTDSGKGEAVEALVIALKNSDAQQLIRDVRNELATIEAGLPAGMHLSVFYDRSDLINRAVGTVTEALWIAVLLVVILLGLFIGDVRTALVVAVNLPMSALMTFILMDRFGMSANLMSLGGLAIAIGMLVDGAVVVVENTVTRMQQASDKLPRLHVIYRAVREVTIPIVSGTLIILLVFSPLVTLQGLEGKLFAPVALTIMFALASSLVVSLTLIPVLITLLIRADKVHTPRWVESLQQHYRASLQKTLKNPVPLWIGIALGVLLAIFAYVQTGKAFMPEMDEGDMIVQLEKIPTINLQASLQIDQQVEKALLAAVPDIERIIARAGSDDLGMDPMGLNETDMFLQLKPRDEWQSASKAELQDKMRAVLEQFPGLNYGFTQPIAMRVSEMISGSRGDLAIKVFGSELDELQKLAGQIASYMETLPGASEVLLSQGDGMHYLQVTPDDNRLRELQLTTQQVQESLRSALEGLPAGQIIYPDRQMPIQIKQPGLNQVQALLNDHWLVNADGQAVPLSSVVSAKEQPGPVLIKRERGQRFAVITVNVDGVALSDFVAAAQQAIADNIQMPVGYHLIWGGEFENQQRANARLGLMIPVAIALVLLVLFTTFGNMSESILILCNIPFALIGGIVALWISGEYLSVPASVGFIALLGVAVLNGVVLVDQFRHLASTGMPNLQLVVEGATSRLRPVLMTASTGAVGLLPLLFATGPGSEIQKPLAIVVTGGLFTSTLLTLYVLPLLYRRFILEVRS
jgi:heavy metal efflux system protein